MQVDGSQVVSYYKPPLMRLTLIGAADVEGGEPTPAFVDPLAISSIRRTKAAYSVADSRTGGGKVEYHPSAECTEVNCCHFTLLVVESPGQVAMLRDRALGHELPKPKAAT